MKYLVASKARPLGSVKDTDEVVPRLLELLTKWTPPEGMTVHQWLTSLDGSGGFIILETDNPADLVTAASAFGPFYEFQITPVIDFAEAVPAVQKGMEYRNSV